MSIWKWNWILISLPAGILLISSRLLSAFTFNLFRIGTCKNKVLKYQVAFYSIKLKNSLKKTTIIGNSFIFWIAFAFPLEFCLFYEMKKMKKTAFVCQTPCNNNNNVCCLSFLGWVDWLTSLVVFTRSRKKIGARAIWRILERIWVDTRKHFCEVNLQNGIMSLPPLNYSRWKQISFLPRVDSNY